MPNHSRSEPDLPCCYQRPKSTSTPPNPSQQLARVSPTIAFHLAPSSPEECGLQEHNFFINTSEKICSGPALALKGLIIIENVSSHSILLFKVQTTAPEKFRVSPSHGFVQKVASVAVDVLVLPGVSYRSLPSERFQVVLMEVPKTIDILQSECVKNRTAYVIKLWKNIGASGCDLETHRLVTKLCIDVEDQVDKRSHARQPKCGCGDIKPVPEGERGPAPCERKSVQVQCTPLSSDEHTEAEHSDRNLNSQLMRLEAAVCEFELQLCCLKRRLRKAICLILILFIVMFIILCLGYAEAHMYKGKGCKRPDSNKCAAKGCSKAHKSDAPAILAPSMLWYPLM